jgi:hypothetical protein
MLLHKRAAVVDASGFQFVPLLLLLFWVNIISQRYLQKKKAEKFSPSDSEFCGSLLDSRFSHPHNSQSRFACKCGLFAV